jgi:hypothetical protein
MPPGIRIRAKGTLLKNTHSLDEKLDEKSPIYKFLLSSSLKKMFWHTVGIHGMTIKFIVKII